MSEGSMDISVEFCSSYGTHLLDHLAADGACLTGGQVTVVTIGQVDADLGSCLHLELVHGLTCLGNVQLIVVLSTHCDFSPFDLWIVSGKQDTFRMESVFFSFRMPSLTKEKKAMSGE